MVADHMETIVARATIVVERHMETIVARATIVAERHMETIVARATIVAERSHRPSKPAHPRLEPHTKPSLQQEP